MADAGGEAVGSATEAAEGEAEFPAQLVEVAAAAVRELGAFEQVPDALVGIELRRIGRQAFQVQPLRRPRREEVLHRAAAVDGSAVPDYEQRAAYLAQ